MTSLATSTYLVAGLRMPDARVLGLRSLLGRMAALPRRGAARRAMEALPDHLLRDLGLGRGDLDGL